MHNGLTLDISSLKLMIDQLDYPAFIKDTNHRHVFCNQHHAKAAGFDNAFEVIGLQEDELHWTRRDQVQYINSDILLFQKQQPLLKLQETQTNTEGLFQHIETSKYPIVDNKNKLHGVFGYFKFVSTSIKISELLNINSVNQISMSARKKFTVFYKNQCYLFSKKELLCALLTAIGFTALQIATHLYLSKRTIETHLENIKNNFGVSSKSDFLSVFLSSTIMKQPL